MIEISHLVKKYGNHTAVDDVSLTMEPGRIYGFLGPNGAGKSTTMNIVTGYLGATGGEVKINGFDILKQPEEAKKCIGYLPEIPPLYMDMSVEEYLNFAAELKALKKKLRKQYVAEAMELTMISDMKNRLIRNLSKGYRQRVGLAQAVLGYPEVIILDEPTVGLDPKQILEIRELIKKLGEKHTVILSSHILSEVSEVCDYIFIISKGKLVANDTTEHLLKQVERGGRTLELLVRKDGARAEELLREQWAVEQIEISPGAEEDTVRLAFMAEEGTDIRNQLIKELVAADIPLLELKSAGKSLEDIFLELTDQVNQETDQSRQESLSGDISVSSGDASELAGDI
ncbi:MAG: ABC transporter ATP-binding protein [Lachnospiraceae bacterium]|nr:ABC transporter ATP-binding protein [Lachnospiraceae bacterium]